MDPNNTVDIREALSTSMCYLAQDHGDDHNDPECQPCIIDAAARAYADLLGSDALIIRRDENGEWPADVIGRVGPILEPHPSWSDPLHYRASLVVLREATVRKLDALASSQGVEP